MWHRHKTLARFIVIFLAILLFGCGSPPTGADPKDRLVDAVESNDVARLEALLKAGANPNSLDFEGRTPSYVAALNDSVESAKVLMRFHADMTKGKPSDGNSPLHAAAQLGRIAILRFLLNNGIPVDIENNFRQTPLHFAAWYGQNDVVKILLDAHANPNAKDYRGQTALFLQQIMKKEIADENATQPSLSVKEASVDGNAEIVETLVRDGARINARAVLPKGYTPLMAAVTTNNDAAAKALLDLGADPRLGTDDGDTPLSLARRLNNSDLADRISRRAEKGHH